jgi:hypothetical protein
MASVDHAIMPLIAEVMSAGVIDPAKALPVLPQHFIDHEKPTLTIR